MMNDKSKEDKRKKEEELNTIYHILKLEFGSIYNILGYGGCGTYLLLGPTESGKTFIVEQLVAHATCGSVKKKRRVKFGDVILLSATSKDSKDFKQMPTGSETELVELEPTEENFANVLKQRQQEIDDAINEEGLDDSLKEEWAQKHPILVIFDDTYGKIDMTNPNNQVSSLATLARHKGIYLVLCIQYIKQCGPPIKDNARAVICLSTFYKDHRFMISNIYGYLENKDLLRELVNHNKLPHSIIVYMNNWVLRDNDGNKVPARRVLKLHPIKDYIKNHYVYPEDGVLEYDSDDSNIESDLEKELHSLNKKIDLFDSSI